MSESDRAEVNPYVTPAPIGDGALDEDEGEGAAPDQPLFQCMTKAIRGDINPLRYGGQWALSRRDILSVFQDRLECGDWTLRYSEQVRATLLDFRSTLGRSGKLLTIVDQEDTYHFGLRDAEFWCGDLPFVVQRGNAKLSYSALSIAARVMLFLGLLILLYSLFSADMSGMSKIRFW